MNQFNWRNSSLTILLLLFAGGLLSAQMTVRGNVTDAEGFPISDALVRVENSNNETATDQEGNYELQVQADEAQNGTITLEIDNFLSKVTEQFAYEEGATLTRNVNLSGEVELEAAVAIGYGTVRKEDLTGAVDLLTEEDFNQGNVVTPENLIQGRSPGVNVNTSGAPGSGSTIRIRGGASLTASNDPLIVIDGLPITNRNVGGGRSILSSINPNDIESFSILKDASATAIYGARGSNGVIIITTKKGGKKVKVDYSFNFAANTLADQLEVFSADGFRNLITDRIAAGQVIPQALLDRIGTANTNWQDQIFRNTVSTNHNLSLRGSLFGAVPVRLSAGYNSQPGTLRTSSFERSNVSLNLSPKFFDDHLKFNVNANYSLEDNRFGDVGQVVAALRYNPTVPVFDPTNTQFGGYFQYSNQTGPGFLANSPGNPLAALSNRNNSGDVNRFFGSAELDYKFHFFPELRAKLFVGGDFSRGEGSDISNAFTYANATQNINRSAFESERNTRNFTGSLIYTKSFGKWDIDATAAYDYQKYEESDFTTGNLNNPTSEMETTRPVDLVLISLLGRVNIGFANKYLLTLNYNRNASSRFGNQNRWGNFPGAAFAWKMSEENFLAGSQFLSTAKLRLGWGITGQQDFNQGGLFNLYQSVINQSNNVGGYIFGVTPVITGLTTVRNDAIKWEETEQFNVGFDYGLFNDRITGSIDVYQKNSDDLLFNAPVADGANFSNQVTQNIGEFQVRGLEFTIGADIVKSSKFNWNLVYNMSFIDREVSTLAQGTDIITGGGIGANASTILRENEVPGSFFSFQQIFNANGQPIEGAFVDIDGNGIINTNDRYVSGDPDPDVFMGLVSNISYGNFDLFFNLRSNIGGDVFNQINAGNAYFSLLNNQGFPSNLPTSVLDGNFEQQDDQKVNSDFFIEDGTFLRMDNITLGYTFDKPFGGKGSVRVWTGVQNVFILTDYSGLDPEVPGENGIDNGFYPRPRTFMAGAQFSF